MSDPKLERFAHLESETKAPTCARNQAKAPHFDSRPGGGAFFGRQESGNRAKFDAELKLPKRAGISFVPNPFEVSTSADG